MYTEERLQRVGLSLNGSCHFCKEKETLLHLFVHCKFVDSVWIEVFDKDLKKLQSLLTLFRCLQNILFGKKEMLLNIRKRL